MNNNKFNKNLNTLIISIIISILISSIIYFIHNTVLKSYVYNIEYTYICNNTICDYESIKDLHNDLENQFSEEKNIDKIINFISNISNYNLTEKEIKKSISIKHSNNKIIFVIKNKNAQKGFLIYVGSQEVLNNFDLDELNITFTKKPNYNNYLKYSLFIGSILGLLLIASDTTLIKIEKEEKKEMIIEENHEYE